MLEKLKDEILLITFIKKNGDTRKMVCTLKEDTIPKVAGNSKPREGIITVFDIESNGWRSIIEDSIQTVEVYKET